VSIPYPKETCKEVKRVLEAVFIDHKEGGGEGKESPREKEKKKMISTSSGMEGAIRDIL